MEELEGIINVRKTLLISPLGGNPNTRIGYFLKPIKKITQKSSTDDSRHHTFIPQIAQPPVVKFSGWSPPPKDWRTWVAELQIRYENTWIQAGICEAIRASAYTIPRDPDLVLLLAQRWNPRTNTFFFPWGEATITLEDMMVLSGYSVLGVPIFNGQLENKDLVKIEERLDKVRRQLQHTTARKASHNPWMRHFMENENDRDLEHEAFLSLWLCRFVFPPNAMDTVPQNVFPLSIRLARGTRIALAPAVLATLYRDLSWLNTEINSAIRRESVTLLSPLQLVHVWALERFPNLQPNAYRIEPSEPRLAKWHKLRVREKADLSLHFDNAGGSFLWRPYSQCCSLKFYCENAQWEYLCADSDKDFLSFARCLRPSMLVAMDCTKQYLPHRVALQFGMDQDIPGNFTCFRKNHIVAWQNYDRPMMGTMVYVPSSTFNSQVTRPYFEWWRLKLGYGSVKSSVRRIENEDHSVPAGY